MFEAVVEMSVRAIQKKWMLGSVADKLERQFTKFIRLNHVQSAMKEYRRSETRLDHHWMTLLNAEKDEFGDVKFLVQLVCSMSQGNAFLERGFSINREVILDRQKRVWWPNLKCTMQFLVQED